ncbi:unnamed protein product [Rodentolepis nana]|uniref:SEC7 domain-containing protein n=1 Tax=Rodentolepis nana TaxID=102285 RepID=A0A0R3T8B8_RODNA|nr:unnamed protein product [Rodentolepis nana]
MERDDFRNQKIQEFVNRVRTTPYGAMIEPVDAAKIAKLFLRARKFDVTRALELYKSYRHMRYSNQLEAIDPLEDGVRRELLSEKFTVLLRVVIWFFCSADGAKFIKCVYASA